MALGEVPLGKPSRKGKHPMGGKLRSEPPTLKLSLEKKIRKEAKDSRRSHKKKKKQSGARREKKKVVNDPTTNKERLGEGVSLTGRKASLHSARKPETSTDSVEIRAQRGGPIDVKRM